ncbi:hypothetical protein DOY81_012908 [Sarcophaga bullata]|nr:hypothetical protein DOY81_012908 [Sarcophaga bullata]
MPKLLNGLHHNGHGAIAPELVESQPQIMKNVLKSRRPKSKFWIVSMIIEGNRPKGNHELEDDESSLETPLQYEQNLEEQVCLLRDSPFRILRYNFEKN